VPFSSSHAFEDRVAVVTYAALSSSPDSPDISWWTDRVDRAPSRAARAGVIVAAMEAGFDEQELLANCTLLPKRHSMFRCGRRRRR
jgi:hypothetical protein